MPPPNLFDPQALNRKRLRVAQMAHPAMFLHDLAAAQVSERLREVNRRFTKAALIAAFPDPWLNFLPDAQVFEPAEILGLGEDRLDLLIHGFSLHNSNDPVGQLIQCRRALRPDGLFIGVMFGGQTLTELRVALAEAEVSLTGGLSPRVAPMAELRDLGGLLQRAGFALPVADTDPVPVTYPTAFDLMRDLRAMGETNVLGARRKTFTPRTLLLAAAEIYARRFQTADGHLKATFELAFLTGWAPGDNQQKPLRPGSARSRLADALGTVEFDEDGR